MTQYKQNVAGCCIDISIEANVTDGCQDAIWTRSFARNPLSCSVSSRWRVSHIGIYSFFLSKCTYFTPLPKAAPTKRTKYAVCQHVMERIDVRTLWSQAATLLQLETCAPADWGFQWLANGVGGIDKRMDRPKFRTKHVAHQVNQRCRRSILVVSCS